MSTCDHIYAGSDDGVYIDFPDNPGSGTLRIRDIGNNKQKTGNVVVVGVPASLRLRAAGNNGICVKSISVGDTVFTGAMPTWLDKPPEDPIGGSGDSRFPNSAEVVLVPAGVENIAALSITACSDAISTNRYAGAGVTFYAASPSFRGAVPVEFSFTTDVTKDFKYTGPLPTDVTLMTDNEDGICIAKVTLDGFEFTGTPFWLQNDCNGGFVGSIPCMNERATLLMITTTATTTVTATGTTVTTTTTVTATGTTVTTTTTVVPTTTAATQAEITVAPTTVEASASSQLPPYDAATETSQTPTTLPGGSDAAAPSSLASTTTIAMVVPTTTAATQAESTGAPTTVEASASSQLPPYDTATETSQIPTTVPGESDAAAPSSLAATTTIAMAGPTMAAETSMVIVGTTESEGNEATTTPLWASGTAAAVAGPTTVAETSMVVVGTEKSEGNDVTSTPSSQQSGTTAAAVGNTRTSPQSSVDAGTTDEAASASTKAAHEATSDPWGVTSKIPVTPTTAFNGNGATTAPSITTTPAPSHATKHDATTPSQSNTAAPLPGDQGVTSLSPNAIDAATTATVAGSEAAVTRTATSTTSAIAVSGTRAALSGSSSLPPDATTVADATGAPATTTTVPLDRAQPQPSQIALAQSMQAAVAGAAASVLNDESEDNATVVTPFGTAAVFRLGGFGGIQNRRRRPKTVSGGRGSKVNLPFTLSSLGAKKLAAMPMGVGGAASTSTFNQPPGRRFSTPPMEISLFDENNRPIKGPIPGGMLFRLPGDGTEGECAYLDGNGIWSPKGVRRATRGEVLQAGEVPDGIWCNTSHLSIFAAIADIILGCTNMELFSGEAARAITERSDWYNSEPAIIVFGVWSLLVLALLIGYLWECWVLRLGRSHEDWKSVNICKNFMKLGPQLLKHRYVAFLVYARDVVQCIRTGHTKLKKSILTSSVQRFLAVRTGISVPCVTQHCWNGGGWANSKASLPYTVICRKLQFHAGEADRVFAEDISAPGVIGVARRFLMTFLAVHPLLDSMRVGPGSMTVAKRATLQVAGICGVLATNALIFNFSGELRSWEIDSECPISPTSQLFIVVASIVSILVNALPNAFLADLAKQVHGRPLWNITYWVWTLAYLACAVYTVLVALSNLNLKDQNKWRKSLEWGMTIKLLGMPLAQTTRNTILLELFLRHDRTVKPSERFRAVMGLCHPNEVQLSCDAEEEAKVAARQAISADELVTFTSLLGDKVMPDFNPETSTADDVMEKGITPMAARPPPLSDFPVRVEVVEVTGLPHTGAAMLSCSVIHLGKLVGNARYALGEQASKPAPLDLVAGKGRCCWGYEASVQELAPEQALGFVVALSPSNKQLGVGCLATEELLLAQQATWSGILTLHPMQQEGKCFTMPNEAAAVPKLEVHGSKGGKAGSPAQLAVKVHLPEGYLEALSMHALQRLKKQPIRHCSEVEERDPLAVLSQMSPKSFEASHSFCEEKKDGAPAEAMVVHSRQKNFVHLVATILADALGQQKNYKAVEAKIMSKDFHGLHDMLREAGCEKKRYWMEIFALPASRNEGWHENFMSWCPTILREMRKACSQKVVADITAGKAVLNPSPLKQLLIMDRNFHFMHEATCLSELMLAHAMRVTQRIVLHPEHLSGGKLGDELRHVAEELGKAYNNNEVSYTIAYLENKQAVYDALRELIVGSIKEHKADHEDTWKELNMHDLAATIGAYQAGRGDGDPQSQGRDGEGDMELGGGDADVDVDA